MRINLVLLSFNCTSVSNTNLNLNLCSYEEKGIDLSLDTYPYLPSSTSLSSVLPSWALAGDHNDVISRLNGTAKGQPVPSFNSEGKNEKMKENLQGKQLLEQIREEVCVRGSDGYHGVPVDWDAVVIAGAGSEKGRKDEVLQSLIGRKLGDAARSFARSPPTPLEIPRPELGALDLKDTQSLADPFNLFLYILIIDDLGTTVVLHVGHEDNVRRIMRHPRHAMCTDGILAPKRPHPRAWASTGRYIGWYGRDLYRESESNGVKTLGPDGTPEKPISEEYPAPFEETDTLEEVIAHLTSRAATRLGLLFDPNLSKPDDSSPNRPKVPRGLVAPGYAGDLVLFDPNTIRDRATFANPSVPCSGIDWVFVNGMVAVEKGQVTGVRGVRTIRRDKTTGLVW